MKKLVIAITVLILLTIGGVYYVLNYQAVPKATNTNAGTNTGGGMTQAVMITYDNLAEQLTKNSIIQSLPESGIINLRFYNFDTGVRAWERTFIMTKGKVIESTEPRSDADLTIIIHSKYLRQLTNTNFCGVINEAKSNGDLGIETDKSTASLGWKYKSLYSQRDCLGL